MRRAVVETLESRVLLSVAQTIRNGGFEGTVSSSDWVRSGDFQADSRFTNFHSGAGYAYLSDLSGNSANSISGTMYQQLTLPSTASSLTLAFWTKFTTQETTTTAANDVFNVQIMDSTGTNVLQTLPTLSNLNASSSYVQRTYFLNRSLIGQTVRLVFSASTNATLPTTFRVDDVSLIADSPATSNRVVGYMPEYRFNADYGFWDPTLFTHANYSFISTADDGTLSTGGVNSAHLDTAVAALHAAGDTISITVGPISFVNLSANPTARANFANNVVNYALAHNLDGIDIDWEPPAGNNYANYGLLISDLYAVAHPQHMLITAAVNPYTNEIPAATVNSYMDWLNVMCYDFAPANHSTYANAVSGMQDWTNYGVAKNKLVMGVPFYGRAGTSWSDTTSQSYTSIVNNYAAEYGNPISPDLDSYVDTGSGKTWYFNGLTTIEKKAAYVRDNGYGGMMTWELGMDHWDSSGKYDQYSLLPVMNSMMRPPTWLTPASGSMFDYVAHTLYAGSGSMTLNANASASDSSIGLSIATGATVSAATSQKFSSVSIPGTGKLDLLGSSLAVDYTGTTSAIGSWSGSNYTGLTGLVAAGRIVNSHAQSHTTLGVYESSQVLGSAGGSFGGFAVDGTAVLIKPTYIGDASGDGKLNIDDYIRIDAGISIGATGWYNGDFNFDGKINIDDYTLIDATMSDLLA